MIVHEIFGGNVLLILSLSLAVNRDEIIPKTKVFWIFLHTAGNVVQ